ncbi:acyl carrier protein [bacterium]|nr:acyl carrier protein [bacterium]
MDNKIYLAVKELVCETLEIPEDELNDDTLFINDLGCDSILIIEMKTQFEERYNIVIDKEDIEELASLKDVVNYLTKRNIKVA